MTWTCRSVGRYVQTCAGATMWSAVEECMAMRAPFLRMDKHVASSIIADPPERDDSVPAAAQPTERADVALPGQVRAAARLKAPLLWMHRWSNWRQWLHDTHQVVE